MKEKTSGQKMLLTAGFMAMATLLSKVLGLVRDSLLTAYFGSGLESDAFLTASTIPTTLFDVIIGGVISAAFIPVFNDIMSKKGKDEAMKFVNKFVTLIVCITLFIVVGGIIFRDVLVNIQAPNYTADKHNLAAGNWTNLRLALLDNFSIFSTFAVFSVSLALYEHTFLMPIINTIDTIILFSHFSLREIAIDYYSRLFPSI